MEFLGGIARCRIASLCVNAELGSITSMERIVFTTISIAVAPSLPPSGCAALLDAAEPLRGVHALVICKGGAAGLDALCGLIARGCDAATELSEDGRVPAEPAEIVLAPMIDSIGAAARVVSLARRSLLPCGRIVLRCEAGLADGVRQLLQAAGFAPVVARANEAGVIVSADLPMFGMGRGMRHA